MIITTLSFRELRTLIGENLTFCSVSWKSTPADRYDLYYRNEQISASVRKHLLASGISHAWPATLADQSYGYSKSFVVFLLFEPMDITALSLYLDSEDMTVRETAIANSCSKYLCRFDPDFLQSLEKKYGLSD